MAQKLVDSSDPDIANTNGTRSARPVTRVVSSIARWSVLGCAAYALIGGAVTLFGWFAGLPRLTDWMASGISMFPNTAFAALCAGAALILARARSRWCRRVSGVLGLTVLLLGGATLVQHLSGHNLGIDGLLLATPWGNKAAVAPGRMGPPASASYALVGLALVLMAHSRGRLRRIVPALGTVTCAIAALGLMGYALDADPLYAVARVTGIAMQTASILLALALGIIASVPEYEPVRTFRQKSAAGLLARRSLPFVIGVPLILGWVRVYGQNAGWFDTVMGTALMMLAVAATFCGLLWWWVGSVAGHEHQIRGLNSELKQKLEEMTTLQELLPVGVWIGNHDCSEIRGNTAGYRMLGLPENIKVSTNAEQPEIPAGLRIRVNGLEVPSEELPMQKVSRTGRPWSNFEHDIIFPDGVTKVLYGSVAPLFDENGQVRQVIAAYTDFTERKRAEEELRHRTRQLETLIERAPLGVFLVDADFRIAQVNPVALPVFGDIPGGVIGREFAEVVHLLWEKNFAGQVVQIFRHTLETGESYFAAEQAEYRTDRQLTEYYEWRLERITLPDGRYGLVCYFRDISQQVEVRKRIEESRDALGESERVQRLLAQVGELGARFPETDELIGAICERVALELGVSRCGYTLVDLAAGLLSVTRDYHGHLRSIAGVYPFSPYGEANRDAIAGRITVNDDLATHPRSARDYPTLWAPFDLRACVSVPLYREGQWAATFWVGHHEPRRWTGTEVELMKLIADRVWLVVERKRAEESLRESEARERAARNEAEQAGRVKDEFLATLSHELRTPLNAILGWSQLLDRHFGDEKTVREGIEVITRNARMQADLIADLLDMSRIVSGKLRLAIEDVNLSQVATAAIDAVRHVAEAKGIRIEPVLGPPSNGVRGDPGRLQQVVWNLLSNALKFTPGGGCIQVRIDRNDSNVEIAVNDSGMGIKPEFLPHLFERFRQADSSAARQHGGLGLGLAIVKHLTELHGGDVRAESRGEGHGAAFTVRLPLAAGNATAEITPCTGEKKHETAGLAASDDVDLSGIRVLAIDDQADTRELLSRVLAECHAEVIVASSSDEGLRALEDRRPHVVLCDIGMPGTDGYAFLRAMRNRGHQTPALAVTAFARPEDRSRAIRAGYQGHISKPFEPAELVTAVAALARGFQATGSRVEGPPE